MKKRLVGLAVGLAFLLGFAYPFPAAAVNHDANIKLLSQSDRSTSVCKDLVSNTVCGNTTGTLKPGENARSKFGWSDTDAIYVWSGCDLYRAGGTVATYNTGWYKVSGTNGITFSFDLRC